MALLSGSPTAAVRPDQKSNQLSWRTNAPLEEHAVYRDSYANLSFSSIIAGAQRFPLSAVDEFKLGPGRSPVYLRVSVIPSWHLVASRDHQL